MRLDTPEIAWHGKEPILSVDFSKIGSTWRLASAGADKDVKIWSVFSNEDQHTKIEFLANLSRHTKAVNVVKFSPKEEILASGGDDSMIILWKLNASPDQNTNDILMETDDIQNKESWTFHKALRGHIEDVYDLCWSPDGNNLISGSVDNSAIIWDIVKGQKLIILKDHKHYVQGVCWDPLGQYVVTNSSDRSCRLYNPNSYRCCYNIAKLSVNGSQKTAENGELFKQGKMFHDETMPSFFRRPSYSPDGSLLIVPAGRLDVGDQVVNATYVFTRASPNKPVLYLPSPQKATVAVRCCPILFELRQDNAKSEEKSATSVFKLPYRMVFAIATLDSIVLYDTQQTAPFGYISNIHYAALTDVAWSNDGSMLLVSSSDGYCSIAHFKKDELGVPYSLSVKQVLERSSSPLPQNSDTPGKITKKAASTLSAEKDSNEEKVDKPQPLTKKEPVGRINMFTVPMKITPTKPASKVTPKRITLTPAPVKPSPNNPAVTESNSQASSGPLQNIQPVTNAAGLQTSPAVPRRVTLTPVQGPLNASSSPAVNEKNQTTPRRVPLIPAVKSQLDKSPDQNKATAQVTPRRVALTPVVSSSTNNTPSAIQEPSMVPGQIHTSNAMDWKPLSNGDGHTVSSTSSVEATTRHTSPPQTTPQTIPSTTPRRVSLTTLTNDAGKGHTGGTTQPSQSAETCPRLGCKESETSVDQQIPQQKEAKESAVLRCTNTEPSKIQPTLVEKPISSSKPRRVALTPVPMETQAQSITSLVDKENNKINQFPITSGQVQPKRVTLTTLAPLGSEKQQSSTEKYHIPRRPIPLEPTVIVLED